MKILNIIFLILITSITISQAQKFKLTGQIIGTEKGDTLRFDKINTRWKVESGGFDVIINKHGKIKYSGKQEHSQRYGVSYYPVDGDKPISDKSRLSVFITDGIINITGTREHIYYLSLEGGVYDSELNKILSIEDSLGKIRNGYYQLTTTAHVKKDTQKMQRYNDLFNNFYRDENVRENLAKVKKMKLAYRENNQNEYVAHEVAMDLSVPLKEIKDSYKRFSPEVQESYYGKQVKQVIEELEALEPGQPAPDFKLISTKADTIMLETFKGKYLLIYHFGLCPGSMQIDEHVINLYNKYKDQLNVVGYTSSLQPIHQLLGQAKDGGMLIMGMDLKVVLTRMTNHPWKHDVEAESIPENIQLDDTYKFLGLPYFILISPEGKMIGRGYRSVFSEAGNILENL